MLSGHESVHLLNRDQIYKLKKIDPLGRAAVMQFKTERPDQSGQASLELL